MAVSPGRKSLTWQRAALERGRSSRYQEGGRGRDAAIRQRRRYRPALITAAVRCGRRLQPPPCQRLFTADAFCRFFCIASSPCRRLFAAARSLSPPAFIRARPCLTLAHASPLPSPCLASSLTLPALVTPDRVDHRCFSTPDQMRALRSAGYKYLQCLVCRACPC